jgi:hypothetical protein|tara:strand:- start:4072 stop:4545 length:474 start_codon:yes stop_codon:yes gene_type:complete
MNVAVGIEDFDINSVFYQKPITNTVMEDASFIRILYSNELITINGIFIKINLKINSVEAYYNKYKCIYNKSENFNTLSVIKSIENQILNQYFSKKSRTNKIGDQLNSEAIKIFTETNVKKIPCEFILKISGLWETATEYGITYKFTHINHQLQNTPV